MAENTAPTDDQILALAQTIKAERGIPLVEAMDFAANKLSRGKKAIDTEFTLHLNLKPKVAKFYRDSFAGHPDKTVEEWMAQWVTQLLQQQRGQALARTREDLDIEKDRANTLRRSAFLEKTGGL